MTRRGGALSAVLGALAVAVLLIAANALATRFLSAARLDVTEHRIHTLSTGTRQVLASLREPVTLRLFYSRTLGASVPGYGAYADRVRDMLRQYESVSAGRVRVELYDPEPFSDVEDRAIGYGLRGIPVGQAGEAVYFGLAGSNLLDDERSVPFFEPTRERFLEYHLTRIVHELSDPRRPLVGVLSALPLDGEVPATDTAASGDAGGAPWVAMTELRQAFAVRRVAPDATAIDPDLQVLVLVHPQDLPPPTLYAIDQYVMRGGRLLAFVDPHSEAQAAQPSSQGAARRSTASDLRPLLEAWGVGFDPTQVVGDPDGAWRVHLTDDARGPAIDYVPWFNIRRAGIASDDPATGDLDQVTVAAAGHLEQHAGTEAEFVPLLRAGPAAGLLPTVSVNNDPDPAAVLAAFQPGAGNHVLAARLRGPLHSAFDAPPPGAAPGAQLARSDGPANVVVVADSDVLADRFWVRAGSFAGQPQRVPFSDNGAFVVNLAGTLAGRDALLGLRARGGTLRPLTRIDAMQRAAEQRYQSTEQHLRTHLDAIKKRLDDLRAGRDGGAAVSRAVITAEQQHAIDDLTREVADTRGQLRRVQLDLRRGIDRLEATVRLVNVVALPVLLALATIAASLLRRRRRARA